MKIERTKESIALIKALASKNLNERKKAMEEFQNIISGPILEIVNKTTAEAAAAVMRDACERLKKDGIEMPQIIIVPSAEVFPKDA